MSKLESTDGTHLAETYATNTITLLHSLRKRQKANQV